MRCRLSGGLLFAGLLGGLASGCAGPGVQPETTPVINVRVAPLPAGDWQVDYQLPSAVRQVQFWRPGATLRDQHWQFGDAFQYVIDGNAELLQRRDGAAFDRMRVRVPNDVRMLPGDFQSNPGFSDGSKALYTGRFNLVPDGAPDDLPPLHRFTFVPRAGERVVANGQVSAAPVTWMDRTHDGRYVYFGSIEPTRAPGLLAVVDPGLPTWLRDYVDAQLPRLLTVFAERFDAPPPETLTLLLSVEQAGEPVLASSQGALIGSQMLVAFQRPPPVSERARQEFVLAHETAHIWNGNILSKGDEPQAHWRHEGGADALTWAALEALGDIDAAQRQARALEALNLCLVRIGTAPVTDPPPGTPHPTGYACGHAMQMLTDAAGRANGVDDALFEFWRGLYADYGGKPLGANQAEFIRRAAMVAKAPWLTDFLTRFANDGLAQPVQAWVRALNRVGLAFELSPDPAGDQSVYAWTAMRHLMAQDCGGMISFAGRPDGFQVFGADQCQSLRSTIDVARIGDALVPSQGAAALDAVVTACADGGTVALHGVEAGPGVEVPCTVPLLPRPPLFASGRD